MNGQKGSSNTANKKNAASAVHEKENVALKSEVSQLKSKLEQMTKNIDELTSLVQKVSLQQQKQEQQTPPPAPTVINSNNKRTKVEDTLPPLPDIPQSFGPSFGTTTATTNTTSSSMEVDDFSPPSIPSPMHPTLTTSETPSELSDDTFVDQLFTAFKTEHFDFEDTSSQATPKTNSSQRASPELMAKLSDALATLPVQIQELIVNRLVQAITAPKEIQDALPNRDESIVPQSPPSTTPVKTQTPNLPLAAATLAALLAQYGEDAIKAAAKDAAQTNNAKHQANTANSNRKALLIPVHA
jgi:heat shock transcription factor 2